MNQPRADVFLAVNTFSRNSPRDAVPLVTCYADTDLMHASYAVTGLLELASQGALRIEFRLRDRRIGVRGPYTLWFVVRNPANGKVSRVCCDCHDGSTCLCDASLAGCDYYYKSNLSEKTFLAAPADQRSKLRSFGPYTPMRPHRASEAAMGLRWLGNLYAHLRSQFFTPHALGAFWKELVERFWVLTRHRRYFSRKTWTEYEHSPQQTSAAEAAPVFFNPTCWTENGPTEKTVNEFRAEVILKLRDVLGPRFTGGFRRSEFAERHYRSAIEDRPRSHDEFVRCFQAAPIAVYTNGLSECFSWRLVELFASSKCIVSERIPNDAGYPLDSTSGVLQCDDPDQIVATVQRLLNSPDEVAEMQQSSWKTYCERMRPHIRMQHLLDDVLAQTASNTRAGAHK